MQCYVDNVIGRLENPFTVPTTSSSAGNEHAQACTTSSHDGTGSSCKMLIGSLVLMRSWGCKGESFSPFTPLLQVLLLFPCSIDPFSREQLASGAAEKISAYLRFLHGEAASDGGFELLDAVLCQITGNVAVVLQCATLDVTLSVLRAVCDCERQGPEMRMSPLYIRAMPCEYHAADAVSDALKSELAQGYYHIPTCALCTERIEPSLAGQSDTGEAPICDCYNRTHGTSAATTAAGRTCCTCPEASTCLVCQKLLTVQVTSNHASDNGAGEAPALVRCQECRQSGDPWICMICGYVGCSRYQAMHAKDHYVATRHSFSINLLTQQIWDYDSDAFVHHVMFLTDNHSGKTTRLVYPGREDDASAALAGAKGDGDDDTSPGAKTEAYGFAPDGSGGEAYWAKDPVTEKKFVSSKYDATLTPSHAQYATVMKSELDAARAEYTDDAWLRVREADPDTELTREDVSHHLTRPSPLASNRSDDSNAGIDGRRPPVFRRTSRTAARHVDPAQGIDNDSTSTDPFARISTALDPAFAALHAGQREMQTAASSVRNIADEKQMLEEEARVLVEEQQRREKDLRAVVQKNLMRVLELNHTLDELKSTLTEINLNVSTQQRLLAMMGDSESASRVVLMGEGRKSRETRAGQLQSKGVKRN